MKTPTKKARGKPRKTTNRIKREGYTGLEIVVKENRLVLISRRGGFLNYQELDITPVYHFLKEMFEGKWRKPTPKKKRV